MSSRWRFPYFRAFLLIADVFTFRVPAIHNLFESILGGVYLNCSQITIQTVHQAWKPYSVVP